MAFPVSALDFKLSSVSISFNGDGLINHREFLLGISANVAKLGFHFA